MLRQHLHPILDDAIKAHATGQDLNHWQLWLRENLSNEVLYGTARLISWEPGYKPITGITNEYGPSSGSIRVRWDTAAGDSVDHMFLHAREVDGDPNVWKAPYHAPAPVITLRSYHTGVVSGLPPGRWIQISLTAVRLATGAFSHSELTDGPCKT